VVVRVRSAAIGFDVTEDEEGATKGFAHDHQSRRQQFMGVVVVVSCKHDLFEVAAALGPASSLAGRLHGWKEQGNQNGDDGDHHQ